MNANESCCAEFLSAMCDGTDNEGYGKLISLEDGKYSAGEGLNDLKFCPWCGANLEP